mmetsp:Transcript_39832/g.46603  ORF Transcript_39832/g.46603 Transcript_39832/m.46603 type:complete len:712 (-) Transcript_39832:1-2136(-)
MRALPFLSLYLSIAVSPQHGASAQERTLLNAYKTPLELLTAPGNYYFLEFPLHPDNENANENDQGLQPMCGNGSPYSFVFKRGTDAHVSKLLIEFEGGEACWEEGSCTCDNPDSNDLLARNNRETPWYNYLQNLEEGITAEGYFPTLDQCRGIESGFVQTGSGYLFGNDMFDVPIALRGLSEDTSDVTDTAQEWWEALGGSSDNDDVRDWSYLLLPHCTLDWHLGHRKDPVATGCTNANGEETVYHRGGVNVEFVKDWITTQFDSLDALVVTSGGTVGGCHSSDLEKSAKHTSSIAPAFLGTRLGGIDLQDQDTPNSVLVMMDGSNLFNPELPSYIDMKDRWDTVDIGSSEDGSDGSTLRNTMEFMVKNSFPQLQYAWLASELGGETSFGTGTSASETLREESEEEMWLSMVKSSRPNSFHVFVPKDVDYSEATCPLYAFPNLPSSDQEGVRNFVGEVTNFMSWSEDVATSQASTESSGGFHPTFLTLALCAAGALWSIWIAYYILYYYRSTHSQTLPSSPTELWLTALTHSPRLFLFISLLTPVLFSYAAYAQSGYTLPINLNFDTYLEIDSDMESVARNYDAVQKFQEGSLEIEESNCAVLNGELFVSKADKDAFGVRKDREDFGVRNLKNYNSTFGSKQTITLEDASFQMEIESTTHTDSRNLQSGGKGQLISILYQNRNGGTVFTPETLYEIYDFEQALYNYPGFDR